MTIPNSPPTDLITPSQDSEPEPTTSGPSPPSGPQPWHRPPEWSTVLGKPKPAIRLELEQAAYGSFPFRGGGYAMLGYSPGCRPAWQTALKETAQRFGEPARGIEETEFGLVTQWLADGTWMVVAPFSPGADDRGRPGAMGFHALFLSPNQARKLFYDPFTLEPLLRRDFGPDDLRSPWPKQVGMVTPVPFPDLPADLDPQAARIAAALLRGQQVVIDQPGSPAEIDALVRLCLCLLPLRRRRKLTLATRAFHLNPHSPHLVALARPLVPIPASHRPASSLNDPDPSEARRFAHPTQSPRVVLIFLIFLFAVLAFLNGVGTGDSPSTTSYEPANPNNSAAADDSDN